MGVSYGDKGERGKLGYSMRTKQMRRCNECGYTANVRYASHKVWRNGRTTYCGYMRVVDDEQ